MKLIAILFILATLTSSSQAQDLSKEITVEKEIVPQHINVSRINLTPEVTLKPITNHNLPYSNQSIATPPQALIATLEPAQHAVDIFDAEHRGYLSLGYFPTYNTALSAGYKILGTQSTDLNAWLQYNGRIYNGNTLLFDQELTMRDHTAMLGVNLKQRLSHSTTLNAAIDYTLSRFNSPQLHYHALDANWEASHYQTVNNVNISAGITTAINQWDCQLQLAAEHFGYASDGYILSNLRPYPTNTTPSLFSPARENKFSIYASAATKINDISAFGINLDIAHLNYNKSHQLSFNENSFPNGIRPKSSPDYGLISINPHYEISAGTIHTRIGAQVGIAINDGKSFSIAPDIEADWTPSQLFSIYAQMGGGEWINTLSYLWNINHHTSPSMVYSHSSLPFTFDAGIVIGQWKGATAKLYAGYASAKDWLMPSFYNATSLFTPIDLNGWKLGAEISYRYRDIASIKLQYETAPQKYNRGNYLWHDRAKNVFNASLLITPMPQLDITVDYELRNKRCIFGFGTTDSENIFSVYNLGDIDRFNITGLYRYTSHLSFFARFENLLNNHCYLISTLPDQGFTALLGATYKF